MFNVDNMGEKVENMLDKKFHEIIAKHFSPLEELLETVKSSLNFLCGQLMKEIMLNSCCHYKIVLFMSFVLHACAVDEIL